MKAEGLGASRGLLLSTPENAAFRPTCSPVWFGLLHGHRGRLPSGPASKFQIASARRAFLRWVRRAPKKEIRPDGYLSCDMPGLLATKPPPAVQKDEYYEDGRTLVRVLRPVRPKDRTVVVENCKTCRPFSLSFREFEAFRKVPRIPT